MSKVNSGVICDGCGTVDFTGDRYKCRVCENYDLCENCMDKGVTNKGHLSDHQISKMSASEDKGAIIDVKTVKEFDAIIKSDKLIIVNFHATWYAAAVSFQPKLVEISLQYPTITFIRIDTDQLQEMNQRFQLVGPAIFFFRKGEAIRQLSGISTWGNPKELEQIMRHELGTMGYKEIPTETSTSQKSEKPKIPKRFPQKEPLFWTVGKFDQILNKIVENCSKFDHSLTESEMSALREITNKLSQKEPSWTSEEFSIMEKIISWPDEFRFPALDIFRFFILTQKAASHYNAQFFEKMINNLNGSDPTKLMTLRVFANMFKHGDVAALSIFSNVLGAMGPLVVSGNKNIQLAVATVLLNYAVVLHQEDERTKKLQLMDALTRSLTVISDEEAATRLISGIGTFLSTDKSLKEGFSFELDRFTNSNNLNLKESAQELKYYLK